MLPYASPKETVAELVTARAGGVFVAAVGAALGLAGVAYLLVDQQPLVNLVVELGFVTVFPVVQVYAGYRLAVGEYDSDELWRVARWCFVGVVLFTAVTAWVLLHEFLEGDRAMEPLFLLTSVAAVGAVAGLVLGVHDVRLNRPWEMFRTDVEAEPERIDTETASASADAEAVSNTTGAETTNTTEASSHDWERESAERPRRLAAEDTTVGPDGRASDRSTSGRRWLVVECLVTFDAERVGLEALAAAVCRREADEALVVSNDPERRKQVAISLHHVHLPALSDAGILEYDWENRLVLRGRHAGATRQ
ncbi:DUF7344 domain-containing protein [Haloprofundus halobius]|uniref:DUF7344 domain-containing protein n=1 Tax=Haloprofundus halobius TaxID=2876194 RepID=UPI001CCC53B3|nr:hypothetical protein [Haloprofundus halobius]